MKKLVLVGLLVALCLIVVTPNVQKYLAIRDYYALSQQQGLVAGTTHSIKHIAFTQANLLEIRLNDEIKSMVNETLLVDDILFSMQWRMALGFEVDEIEQINSWYQSDVAARIKQAEGALESDTFQIKLAQYIESTKQQNVSEEKLLAVSHFLSRTRMVERYAHAVLLALKEITIAQLITVDNMSRLQAQRIVNQKASGWLATIKPQLSKHLHYRYMYLYQPFSPGEIAQFGHHYLTGHGQKELLRYYGALNQALISWGENLAQEIIAKRG
ncbi:hypothetical protein [Thalassotalea agarivorans]|uniref:DUF2059 domain-containing protein n=1 Tax=Thalassotalea agarivorans TaxID=349064 RepID=A0A1I0CC24_THASX|nr:hypothetical protein [Thalassotalea agarivorans]SET16958.1 hypothetical protein SAMN05660429_01140 [Thalassotalea agarivorans]